MSGFDKFGAAGGFVPNFLDTSTSPSSGGQNQGSKQVVKAQNCVPVSIRQILESKEEKFKIGQNDVHLVTIVGVLINKESDSTKSTYLFDDYSGRISAHVFACNDAGIFTEVKCEIGQYYRIFGSARMSDGKHHIMTFRIEPLENLNELTMHLLEVIYVPLSLDEHDVEESAASASIGNGGSDFRTSLMNAGSNVKNEPSGEVPKHTNIGLTALQQMVFNMIKNITTESGFDTSTISTNQISRKDLESTLDFLTSEGHIYSTIDDQHYKTTEC